MKPYIHCKNSVKNFGGKVEDYEAIHNFMDSTKAFIPDMRHRAILHNAWGIYICEQIFGKTFTNSDGKVLSVRDIAEQHVIDDLGHIPTLEQCMKDIKLSDWFKPELTAEDIVVTPLIDTENIFVDGASRTPLNWPTPGKGGRYD